MGLSLGGLGGHHHSEGAKIWASTCTFTMKNLKPTKTGRPRVSKGVRLDPDLVEQAELLHINLAALLEAALKTEIRRLESGRGFGHHSK